jgi:hypothetical protein
MWPRQVTIRGIQGNMHVQYSNTLMNILRFFETHILTCYRPTMKQIVSGDFERPRGRACSRTTTSSTTRTLEVQPHPGRSKFSTQVQLYEIKPETTAPAPARCRVT